MQIELKAIERDTTIQCRAAINTETVTDYAEQMAAGAEFPPVELYGTAERCWIGDGWHRVMAADQVGYDAIPATLHPGGRIDALKHALSANATNGLHRTNADKRRSVEIAVAEFPDMPNRQIAELCGVSHHTVEAHRGDVGKLPTSKRRDTLGRMQPATKPKPKPDPQPDQEAGEGEAETEQPKGGKEKPVAGVGVKRANEAIAILQRIPIKDPLREVGMRTVAQWIKANK